MTSPVRLDRLGPRDAYMILIEGPGGHRLKTAVSHDLAENAGDSGLAQELVNKATSLIEILGVQEGYAPLPGRGDSTFYADDPGEQMLAYAEKWGIEIRPMSSTSGEKPA